MSDPIRNRARKQRLARRQRGRNLRQLLDWRSRLSVTVEAVEEFPGQWREGLKRAFEAIGPHPATFASVTLERGKIDLFGGVAPVVRTQ